MYEKKTYKNKPQLNNFNNFIHIIIKIFQVMEDCRSDGGSENGRQEWIMEGFNATRQLEANPA